MKILGLDISSVSTGWAIYNKTTKKWKWGNFKKPSKYKGLSSILYQADKIKELLSKEKPNIVVMEDTFMGTNYKTVKLLNMLRGWVYIYCAMNNFIVYSSLMAKKARKIVGIDTTLPDYTKKIKALKKLYKLNLSPETKKKIDKLITLKGHQKKQRKDLIISFLQERGFNVNQDDQADAIVLVLATLKKGSE